MCSWLFTHLALVFAHSRSILAFWSALTVSYNKPFIWEVVPPPPAYNVIMLNICQREISSLKQQLKGMLRHLGTLVLMWFTSSFKDVLEGVEVNECLWLCPSLYWLWILNKCQVLVELCEFWKHQQFYFIWKILVRKKDFAGFFIKKCCYCLVVIHKVLAGDWTHRFGVRYVPS